MNSSFLQNIDLSNHNPFDDIKISPPSSLLKSVSVSKIIISLVSIIVFIAIFAFLLSAKTPQKPKPFQPTATPSNSSPTITIPSNIPPLFLEKLNQIESEISISLDVPPPEINIELSL